MMDNQQPFNSSIPPSQPLTSNNALLKSSSPPKRSNKMLIASALIIVSLLIIGGGVFAYLNYFQSPEKIIKKMIAKLPEIKSFEYSGETNMEIKMGDLLGGNRSALQPAQLLLNKKDSKTSLKYSGSLDAKKADDPRGLFSFNITTDALPLAELALEAELRVINKAAYLKISEVPNLGFFDLSAIKNQWIKIDSEAVKKQFGSIKLEEQIANAQSKQKLSPEQTKKLKTALEQAKIFEITEKLASEKIEGINTYHYKYIINQAGIRKFLIDSSQIVRGKILIKEELAAFDKSFEAVESLNGEIWIGKKDLLPYKIASNLTIKPTDQAQTSGKISSTLLFKNFNIPFPIEVPAPVKTLAEIISSLFRGFFTPKLNVALPFTSLPEVNVNKDTDNDGLTDKQETIFGTNPNNPDTDSDGYKDGYEVNNGYNPKGEGKL